MTRAFAVAVLVALTVFLCDRAAAACAGCSNPNLPTARASNTSMSPGQVLLTVNLAATTMRVVHSEACPDIGPICTQRNEPPQRHDQRFYVAELRPVAAVAITDVFAAELQLPVRVVDTTIRFRRLDGTRFDPDYENIHHRNESLFGLADPWLLGRASGSLGKVRVTSRAGFVLPVGRTEEDPFARGRAGLSHQHIQFGTGTFAPVFGLDAGLDLDRVRVGTYAQAVMYAYANGHGYRAGNRYGVGATGDVEVIDRLRLGVGADVLNEQPERWGGRVQQDGNLGRTDVLAGGAVSYAFGSVLTSLSVRTPVYQHLIRSSHEHGSDPGQLTYPAIVNLSVQTSFGARSTAVAR